MPLFRLLTPRLTPIYVSVDGPCPAEKFTAWTALRSIKGQIWLMDYADLRAFVTVPPDVSMDIGNWTSQGLMKLDSFRLSLYVKAWDKEHAGKLALDLWYEKTQANHNRAVVFSPTHNHDVKLAVLLNADVIANGANWMETGISALDVIQRPDKSIVWARSMVSESEIKVAQPV